METQARWEELGIENDFMFGKVMQDPELCTELLRRIFPELEIDHIEYPELQKEIRVDVDAKSVRLDVYVKDEKETVYDIEMQTSNTGELPKRTRYYQGMIDLQLIDRGESYRRLKPSFIIFICPSDLFGEKRHRYTFENFCRENKEIPLNDGTTKIFLNAAGEQNDVSDELIAFLDYVAGVPSEDQFIQKLEDAVKKARKNRKWRHEYMTLLMRDQENIEKGMEQGRQQGLQQGLQQGVIAMISALRDVGTSEETILDKVQEKFHFSREVAQQYM